jgi:Ca-activated chloride channel homolog
MRLRNSCVPVLLVILLLTAIASRHQAVASALPRIAEQQAPVPGQQSQDPQAQNQKSPPPPSQSQPAQTQTNQAQPTQGQSAQDQASTDSGVFVFKKEVEEVVLHATVMDDKNHLVTTLDQSAFSVFENNQAQTIASFRHEDVPVAMGIVIDNSGSMREKRDKVNRAA